MLMARDMIMEQTWLVYIRVYKPVFPPKIDYAKFMQYSAHSINMQKCCFCESKYKLFIYFIYYYFKYFIY